jgi:hypothetical protein
MEGVIVVALALLVCAAWGSVRVAWDAWSYREAKRRRRIEFEQANLRG